MYEIINLRSNDVFGDPRIISSHETLGAAISKGRWLSDEANSGALVCIPTSGIGIGAIVFNQKSEQQLLYECEKLGFYFYDSYTILKPGKGMVHRSYQFDPETGRYGKLSDPLVYEADEIDWKLSTVKPPARAKGHW